MTIPEIIYTGGPHVETLMAIARADMTDLLGPGLRAIEMRLRQPLRPGTANNDLPDEGPYPGRPEYVTYRDPVTDRMIVKMTEPDGRTRTVAIPREILDAYQNMGFLGDALLESFKQTEEIAQANIFNGGETIAATPADPTEPAAPAIRALDLEEPAAIVVPKPRGRVIDL